MRAVDFDRRFLGHQYQPDVACVHVCVSVLLRKAEWVYFSRGKYACK